MVKVTNLQKYFGEHQVLKGIDLEVEQGDVVAVLGPSGSGKTTLLRCLNFLERADGGEMEFCGEPYELAAVGKKEIAQIRSKTAFVFQNFNLFLNKTVLQNVTEGLVVTGRMSRAEAESKAMETLKRVGMDSMPEKYPSQLSGGQQQRVAIARGLVLDPEIIYFDEPTSALDPELMGEVISVIRELAASGMTMVIVTHEMSFARSVASKVIFLENGQIVESGPAKEFFENPKEARTREFLKSIYTR